MHSPSISSRNIRQNPCPCCKISCFLYQGYGINGEDITVEDYLKLGDEVVVYGELCDYNGTHELNKGNYIYSLNGQTKPVGINNVLGQSSQTPIFDLAGRCVSRATQGLYIVNGKKVLF